MLTTIFRVILALVHCGYVALETLKLQLNFVKNFAANTLHLALRGEKNRHNCELSEQEAFLLEQSVSRIKKLPVHLCIVVGYDERFLFRHLISIIGWCVAIGIPYVTLYDHNGFLKRDKNIVRVECQRTRPKLASLIDWFGRGLSNKVAENGHNGFKRRTRVQMLSYMDGKREIVQLAKNLSTVVAAGILNITEINSKLLDDKLRLEDTPDPDLVFVCGRALSTYGLLPWHTRTTAFFNLRSYPDVSINDFTFLLEKYGQCKQRFGK